MDQPYSGSEKLALNVNALIKALTPNSNPEPIPNPPPTFTPTPTLTLPGASREQDGLGGTLLHRPVPPSEATSATGSAPTTEHAASSAALAVRGGSGRGHVRLNPNSNSNPNFHPNSNPKPDPNSNPKPERSSTRARSRGGRLRTTSTTATGAASPKTALSSYCACRQAPSAPC